MYLVAQNDRLFWVPTTYVLVEKQKKKNPLHTLIWRPEIKYSITCFKRPLKKNTKIGFEYQLSLNAGQKYSQTCCCGHLY